MTSQVLFRTDPKLKESFKEKVQMNGLSMDYVFNMFMKTYVDNPQIMEIYIDEDAFDEMIRRSFEKPEAQKAMDSLFETIQKK